MRKEYNVNFIKSSFIFMSVFFIFSTIGMLYALCVIIGRHEPVILISLAFALFLVSLFLFILSVFYFPKLKISIDGEDVIYKMPDKTITFKTSDIYKIEKSIYSGKAYYIFFYDNKRKKRHIIFDVNLRGYEELAEYLEKKSSKKSRWEGTLDVENEKRPIIKGLKIIYNIIITFLIIGLLAVYPFMASSNREKERQQHLPERSLWP